MVVRPIVARMVVIRAAVIGVSAVRIGPLNVTTAVTISHHAAVVWTIHDRVPHASRTAPDGHTVAVDLSDMAICAVAHLMALAVLTLVTRPLGARVTSLPDAVRVVVAPLG